MAGLLRPDWVIPDIQQLDPAFLRQREITTLLIDVDGTLKTYRSRNVDQQVIAWAEELRRAGVRLFLISNGRHSRIALIASQLGLPYIARACKPFPFACWRALKHLGGNKKSTALVGDQILTDVLAAKLAGVKSILVGFPGPNDGPWWAWLIRPLEFPLYRLTKTRK